MDIIFLRHGRSKADDERKHEGRYDSPLTEVGKEQAKRRALIWLENSLKFDRIITSPLMRARKTAEIIAVVLGCEVENDDDWMEMNNGVLAGLTYEEANKKYPEPNFITPYERKGYGTGESSWLLHSRAIVALEKIIQRQEGRYLVVAHGGILNATVRMIVGSQPPINGRGLFFSFYDTGYLHTQYNARDHIWVIKEFNCGFKT